MPMSSSRLGMGASLLGQSRAQSYPSLNSLKHIFTSLIAPWCCRTIRSLTTDTRVVTGTFIEKPRSVLPTQILSGRVREPHDQVDPLGVGRQVLGRVEDEVGAGVELALGLLLALLLLALFLLPWHI